MKNVFDSIIEKTELSNGIRIVTERMPFIRSASVGIYVHAGSANETEPEFGIAHYLEHMLFKGTKRRTAKDIALSLESLGGGINGATGKEVSLYNAYSLSEHVPIAIDLLFDILFHSVFDKESLDVEKQVVLSEMMHALEDPEEYTFDLFYQQLFPQHPLGSFIYGTEENILRFTQADLLKFQQNFYTPNRMVVSVAGNIEHADVVREVQLHLEKLPQFSAVQGNNFPPLPAVNPRFQQYIDSFQQSHIMLGTKTCGVNDDKKYILALLDLLVGSGMSSRLFQNIREKYGFTYAVYSFVDLMQTVGVFGMYMGCDEKYTDESVELLYKEIQAIKNGDLSEDEMDMLKRQIEGSLILGSESANRRMKKNGEIELYDGINRSLDESLAIINKLTRTDMIDLTNEIFTDSNINLTIISP